MTDQATTDASVTATGTTKEALLEAGTHIILEKGYNHMGIQEVLQAAGVPKGSFYYYFPSKADFGLQIIERFAAAYTRRLDQYLGDTTLSPLARLRRHLEQSLAQFESRGCRRGCLVGNLGQELADQNDIFRERLETVLTTWRERYTRLFREAQEVGELRTDLDPQGLADFYLNSFEGALLRAKVHKNLQPMRLFMTIMFDDVLRGSG